MTTTMSLISLFPSFLRSSFGRRRPLEKASLDPLDLVPFFSFRCSLSSHPLSLPSLSLIHI